MNRKFMYFMILPLVSIIVLSLTLGFLGYDRLATSASLFTGVVMLANVAYIVFWNSRDRWPGYSWFERLTRLSAFQ